MSFIPLIRGTPTGVHTFDSLIPQADLTKLTPMVISSYTNNSSNFLFKTFADNYKISDASHKTFPESLFSCRISDNFTWHESCIYIFCVSSTTETYVGIQKLRGEYLCTIKICWIPTGVYTKIVLKNKNVVFNSIFW